MDKEEAIYVPPFKRGNSSDIVVKNIPSSETIVNKLVTVPTVVPMTVTRSDWTPSEGERRLFKKLEEQAGKSETSETIKMFIRWENHYHDELVRMYEICMDSKLGISFNKFVQMAYNCSQKEYLCNDRKNSRPLI
jgi:hypothetical protein